VALLIGPYLVHGPDLFALRIEDVLAGKIFSLIRRIYSAGAGPSAPRWVVCGFRRGAVME